MNALIRIGLGLCIAVVFPFMVGFGIESFYVPPKDPYMACTELDPSSKIKFNTPPTNFVDPMSNKDYKECFDTAQKKLDTYNRNMFLMTAAFGFVAIVVGTLLFSEKVGPVGPGLVFGGLFTILYGTMRSFGSLDKKWIFIELVVVFVGIILVTWRYIKTVNRKS